MPLNPDMLNLPKKRIFKKQAALWKRAAAFVIDFFVVQLVVFWPFQPLFKGLEKAGWWTALSHPETIAISASMQAALFAIIALTWLYFSLFEYYLRQSIGMTIVGVYVEGDVTFFKALVRNCFIIPIFPFFVLWLVEPLHLLFYKFRLLERLTKTNTVEVLQAY